MAFFSIFNTIYESISLQGQGASRQLHFKSLNSLLGHCRHMIITELLQTRTTASPSFEIKILEYCF